MNQAFEKHKNFSLDLRYISFIMFLYKSIHLKTFVIGWYFH